MKMKKYWDNGKLRVMENGRYFSNGETPFFMLGDTAWMMFEMLDEAQAEIYLKNRKEKGFNTILPVLARDNRDMLEVIADDNKAHWEKIVNIVSMAEDIGLYMGILPVWGHVVKNKHLRTDNMEAYISFITERFKGFKNIFWVVGGDCRGDAEFEVWDMMGRLLKQNMPDMLCTYHPFGRTSSSYWFQDAAWIDFHMFQSGHRRNDQRTLQAWDDIASKEPWYGEENFRYVNADYEKKPVRPVLDGEPSYEQIPQGLHDPQEPYWQDHHVRRYAYWSVFAGAAGHVYGHNAVMQFYIPGNKPAYGVKEPWEAGLHDVGSAQMRFLKELMYDASFFDCKPMQEILADPSGHVTDDNIVAFGNDDYIICYSYSGRKIELKDINGMYDAFWFDPVSGVKSYFGKVNANDAVFTPPCKKNTWNDWVLILKNKQDVVLYVS